MASVYYNYFLLQFVKGNINVEQLAAQVTKGRITSDESAKILSATPETWQSLYSSD